MEIIYLPSAVAGLDWFRRYYVQVFPEGEKRAIAQYEKMKKSPLGCPLRRPSDWRGRYARICDAKNAFLNNLPGAW